MKVEVREDSVLITGYVNAVERLSKPIRETLHGKIRSFLERIRAGVFKKALEKNDNVLVLLNHDANRLLASTGDGSAKLEEDNIGLKAEITIKDSEVVEKARAGLLSGWSFGFRANADELTSEGKDEIRTVTDLDLVEVSILDDRCVPAYYGTSIEARDDESIDLEFRSEPLESEPSEDNPEGEETGITIEELAEMISTKVLEKILDAYDLKPKAIAEENGNRSIDYSAFENRLECLKK